MLYSKLFVAAITGISCVAAMPAEQPAELAKAEAFPRGECRDERDELYCGRSVKEFTRYGKFFRRIVSLATVSFANGVCRCEKQTLLRQ